MTYDAGTTKVGWLFPIGTWVVVHNWELGLLFPIGLKFFSVVVFQGKKALWYCNLLEVVFMFPIIIEEGWGGRGGERRGGVVGDPPNTHVQSKDLIHHPPIHVFCKLKKVFIWSHIF